MASHGTWAQLVRHSLWDLSGPGREPVSPELAGGFFTTEPPVKPPLEREHREGKNCTPNTLKNNYSLNQQHFETNDPEMWEEFTER